VPVIASDSGAIPGVMGDCGVLFPEGNVSVLADQLRMVMSDEALRLQLAAQGRTWALDKFTHAQVAAQTVAVYREILAAKQRR
jgi:glycosyltransferase involved in cell wall biosynthesis